MKNIHFIWNTVILVLTIGFLLGCNTTESTHDSSVPFLEDIAIATDGTKFGQGETFDLLVQNHSSVSVEFSPCTIDLQRNKKGKWVEQHADLPCQSSLIVLDGGDDLIIPYFLDLSLKQGTYRIRIGIEAPEKTSGGVVFSNLFEIN